MLYRPTTRWTWVFFLCLLLESLVVMALEIACFITFTTRLRPKADQVSASRILHSFLSLIIIGLFYRSVLAYDMLAQQNTIQIYGICVYSIVLSVLSGLQYSQFFPSTAVLSDGYAMDDYPWPIYNGTLITIIVLSTMSCCWILPVGWKLSEEFAWVVFQKVEADIPMRSRYWTFQILISILKFDVFFFLGFMVQAVVIQTERADLAWRMTIVVIPLSCVLLWVTASSVRHESRTWTLAVFASHIALEAFFVWWFERIFSQRSYEDFFPARKSLALFGGLSSFLSLATIIMIYMCFKNFGKGLKPYVCGGKEARIMGERFETSLRQEYSLVAQA
ncbi:hypothetical protein P170DRAFT_409379 [Aspergillus steynii IBT 23096]|uniref:Uncharacterized protein n=1 Tax=Aspergillus steynii IBT 23096 TaxID=1392250 RepID=A0A2I2GA71_9EURO|nr:uncharacterized protein P170DRAFT_409379 [Aspergillus steynii IBT 23096]PLB49777.1 hypothetical protein P170DRAFT_409379 [Aspergillus steynii IBT 23096]